MANQDGYDHLRESADRPETWCGVYQPHIPHGSCPGVPDRLEAHTGGLPLMDAPNFHDGERFEGSVDAIVAAGINRNTMTVTLVDAAGATVGTFTYVGTVMITHNSTHRVLVYGGDPQEEPVVIVDPGEGRLTDVDIETGRATEQRTLRREVAHG